MLHQLAALMAGRWGQFTRFAQANEAAMRHLTAAAEFIERIDTLAELLRPADTVRGRLRARLALTALFMAGARAQQLGGTDRTRTAAALDAETERAVQTAFDTLARGRTTITIAHRLSTVRNADQIVVLDHGHIAEADTHTSLIAGNGRYAALAA